ncbi:MAG: hypothetical protein HZC55_09220 [Verrucomicrobia bacterium]|nr:hypothetical protein [Verrucomicrobiota bacterium]
MLPSSFPKPIAVIVSALFLVPVAATSADAARWYKGNLHTHSLWSDGDDYPEMIADWYKQQGYHFLAISDHNVMQVGTRWFEIKQPVSIKGEVVQRGGGAAMQKYLARFGPEWVEQRTTGTKKEVRLKPLAEYRALLEEAGRFLLIPSEEITGQWKRPKTPTSPEVTGPVHINVTNPLEFLSAREAPTAVEVMRRTLDDVQAQREKTGQPMFAHINHPNFRWAITVEDLMQVERERFFEVYNGHPGVNNEGDATRLSMDAMWDVMLTFRLAELHLDLVYGVGVDDSHHYHKIGLGQSNAGRGWVMVRARHLTPEAIVRAMESGDFYASSGVTLADVRRTPEGITVEVKAEPGVTYVTQFIGTRRGFDRTSEEMKPPADEKVPRRMPPHRRYSRDIGAVLAEVKGTKAEYRLRGDEIYVRAKVVASKPKVNGSVDGEFETAWVQPVAGPREPAR